MPRIRQSRLQAVILAAIVAARMTALHCQAAIVSGAEYWTIEDGSIPHIIYDRNRGVNFAVQTNAVDNWTVVVHHTRGWGYVEAGIVGASVNQATFRSDLYEVEGTGDIFRFVFYWWPPQDTGLTVRHYGWVTLGKDGNGALTILAAEVADEPDAAIVGRGETSGGDDSGGGDPGGDTTGGDDTGGTEDEEPEDLIFDWVVIDRGDYLELGKQGKPSGASGKITIPAEIAGKPVASIGESAFYGHGEITSVVIPETVSNIGYKAFSCCDALKSCNIPSGVANIGYAAFSHTDLGEIILPDGVLNISEYAFEDCRSLTNATMGVSVTNIGEMAFFRTSLTNVVIPARLDTIGQGAFWNCPGLKEVSVWPWTRLADGAFDSSCEMRYTGTITNFARFAREFGELEVTNLMMIVGREHFDGVSEFRVYDDDDERAGNQDMTSKILYYTGIAPGVVSKGGGVLEAKYVWPTIEIVSFDPSKRQLRGRLVPQGGCRIVAKPEMPWQLGIRRFESPGTEGVNDWSSIPDVSSYADPASLGEFTHTIPEEDFATNRFFRLELVDW